MRLATLWESLLAFYKFYGELCNPGWNLGPVRSEKAAELPALQSVSMFRSQNF